MVKEKGTQSDPQQGRRQEWFFNVPPVWSPAWGSFRIVKEDGHPGSYHLTARFCTSPFLSSSSFRSIFTTFFSLSSSSFMESFCSSIIRSLVAINLQEHVAEVGWLRYRHKDHWAGKRGN